MVRTFVYCYRILTDIDRAAVGGSVRGTLRHVRPLSVRECPHPILQYSTDEAEHAEHALYKTHGGSLVRACIARLLTICGWRPGARHSMRCVGARAFLCADCGLGACIWLGFDLICCPLPLSAPPGILVPVFFSACQKP